MQAFLVRLTLSFFALMPLRLNHFVGSYLGLILYYLKGKSWRVSRINIQLCFADKSADEQEKILKDSLIELGKQFTEMGPMWLWSPEKTLALLTQVSGKEYMDAAMKSNKGVFLLTPHLGCWEIAGLYLGANIPVTILYSRPKIKALDDIVRQSRIRSGAKLVSADASGVKSIFKTLKQGNGTGILPDQNPDDINSGVFAPFFGIQTLTMTFISKLASKTGASIVIGYAERLPKGKGYHLHIKPAVPNISHADPLISATALNQTVENFIREVPAQYQWSYKRFKKRPEGEAKIY
ncbi:lysophospholipid acyltransferase family protein [sulfur-oxidizing endosymbiont of Gigantopelta aegis]|uniref:lysophospholipid acyltransferase family protein n=1 Tax=sulfur-oxidizing endosymbiont of Gigantopelta aegis TaxID=2794934 RepID=UPI002483D5F2|nr:lysophospholipid acyltransferase family protein [sulfur-oxidizing endosymbiont of Gigantopelta aegis]